MPDSFGKRQRRDVKAKKQLAREERRVARSQRREDRAAGLLEDDSIGTPISEDLEPVDIEDILPDNLKGALDSTTESPKS
jgi:hypothetical protein